MSKKINITINKVYTKKGDKGKTDIIGQRNVSKSDLRIICYGEVDELNSSIGFCCALIKGYKDLRYEEMLNSIKNIQNDLFNLGTMLAVSEDADTENFPNIESKDIKALEVLIDYYNKDLESLNSFVLPSGSKAGAYFHVCRTICRRVERNCVRLLDDVKVEDNIIAYLNRLSDLLFVWARWTNKERDRKENLWST